jgi:Type VI secretion system effector, Hcp
MFTRAARTRIAAAAIVAIALGGAAVNAQGNSGKGAPQPVGTIQIGALGAASPIFSLGFSVTNSGSTGSAGGGAGAGKAILSAVEVTRLPDVMSPQLFKDAVLGVRLPAVQISVPGSGRSSPDASYVLNDAFVSGFSTIDGVEHVAFIYRSIDVTIAGARFCFDVAENTAC